MQSSLELSNLLDSWEKENSSGISNDSVINYCTKIAELVERELEAYLKMDPDPFDDRHPGRANPNCALGQLLKILLKNDEFLNKLIDDFLLHRDSKALNVVAARLFLDLTPFLSAEVFQGEERDGLIQRLFLWAENGSSPLRAYATGLLGPAMDIPDVAANYREKNAHLVSNYVNQLCLELECQSHSSVVLMAQTKSYTVLSVGYKKLSDAMTSSDHVTNVPLLLKRLESLAKESEDESASSRPFAHLNNKSNKKDSSSETASAHGQKDFLLYSIFTYFIYEMQDSNLNTSNINECSGSSWQEFEQYVIGPLQMYPLTLKMEQRLILQYLTPMGEYQEVMLLLSHIFEHNALTQILKYTDLNKNSDVRLAFEALKYLASLLCHKKVAIEFINMKGLQKLLAVPRPSLAATGVSVCLYYLAYSEDAMEWVSDTFSAKVDIYHVYVLWLLECSHESSRCHATMFFGLTFPFKVIHELFDEQDGLRKLVNVISTLDILDDSVSVGDDAVFAKRQQARHVLITLKKYYETHLAILADQIRRTHSRNQGGSPQTLQLSKNTKFDSSLVNENIETVMEFMPLKIKWKPVDELHKLGAISLMIQVTLAASHWNFSGRAETVKSVLDVLNVCTVLPRTQISLTEQVPTVGIGMRYVIPFTFNLSILDDYNHFGKPHAILFMEFFMYIFYSIILAAAEGEIVSDPEVIKSAVNVIINCVCGPESKNGPISLRSITGSAKRKGSSKHEDLLFKMWDCVRSNNGIRVLLNTLEIKTPITDADSIRALACRALVGLVRSDTVRQIVGKLPLFINGTLQVLMQEPILQDKRQEHVKFCKYALKLIEKVSGKPLATQGIETSIDKIHKADVVAQTKIIYKDKDLLHLINQHLINKGLVETAGILMKEANLKDKQLYKSNNSPSSSSIYLSPMINRNVPSLLPGRGNSSPRRKPVSSATQLKSNHSTLGCKSTESSSTGILSKPNHLDSTSESPLFQGSNISQPSPKLKINLSKPREKMKHKLSKTTSSQKSEISRSSLNSSPSLLRQSSILRNSSSPLTSNSVSSISSVVTLDSIVTEYLRKQHALCMNPVVTCPPFDLFQYGGPDGRNLDIKHIYSRFRPARSYKDDQASSYSCCAFSACNQYIIIGTVSGELKFYNISTGLEEKTYSCHDSEVVRCEPARDGNMFLISSTWGNPLSALWKKTESSFGMMYSFEQDLYTEFSKLVQDRIVGTTPEKTNIYDVATGQLLTNLKDPKISNHYTKNRATFSPTDEFVLSDGILWDSHNSLPIHKFDKFNSHINGVFHPNGLEIISNSEIWDIRTFHLLKTVPALDQCRITFSHHADVIFGAIMEDDVELDEDEVKSPFGSSFRTFSAHDYSNIDPAIDLWFQDKQHRPGSSAHNYPKKRAGVSTSSGVRDQVEILAVSDLDNSNVDD
ncbi:DDB1- and CUL4-associated factor 1 [Nymphon striatum]|nr:DDB1- and CUL4-associated factor 1 [Nymphon striatum]